MQIAYILWYCTFLWKIKLGTFIDKIIKVPHKQKHFITLMKQLSCHKAVLLFDLQHYLKDPDILMLELPYYKLLGKISDSRHSDIVSQCILYRPTLLLYP